MDLMVLGSKKYGTWEQVFPLRQNYEEVARNNEGVTPRRDPTRCDDVAVQRQVIVIGVDYGGK
jgi:hypothetical protein